VAHEQYITFLAVLCFVYALMILRPLAISQLLPIYKCSPCPLLCSCQNASFSLTLSLRTSCLRRRCCWAGMLPGPWDRHPVSRLHRSHQQPFHTCAFSNILRSGKCTTSLHSLWYKPGAWLVVWHATIREPWKLRSRHRHQKNIEREHNDCTTSKLDPGLPCHGTCSKNLCSGTWLWRNCVCLWVAIRRSTF